MKKEVKNWLDSATYDLATAESMFQTGRYIYTIFMCQLAIEKTFKAKIEEITGVIPPRSHNLRYLCELAGLKPPQQIFEFISKLNDVSIAARYPEDFDQLYKSYDKKTAGIYLLKAKEAFEWIKQSLAR
jgi:HEPN domain-containing protein